MQRVFNKNGGEAFAYRILEVCRPEELNDRERAWIDRLKPKYNVCPVAGSCLGYKHSKETREKHRKLMLDNKINVGRVPWMKGRTHRPESLAQLSSSKKGQGLGVKRGPMPDEVKQKLSRAKLNRPSRMKGRPSGKKGVPWSPKRWEALWNALGRPTAQMEYPL